MSPFSCVQQVLDSKQMEQAAIEEKKRRHDVMAHVHVFGLVCPAAAPIIHLGATSCYVTECVACYIDACTVSHCNDSNADLIFLKRGMELVTDKLAVVIHRLSAWSEQHKDLACLGWTHFQPAQLVTVGKRGTLWLQVGQLQFALIAQLKNRTLQELLWDLRNFQRARDDIGFRGVKGTTGTQASFLALFDGDHDKVSPCDHLCGQH